MARSFGVARRTFPRPAEIPGRPPPAAHGFRAKSVQTRAPDRSYPVV